MPPTLVYQGAGAGQSPDQPAQGHHQHSACGPRGPGNRIRQCPAENISSRIGILLILKLRNLTLKNSLKGAAKSIHNCINKYCMYSLQ